jgi:hypothetical protein
MRSMPPIELVDFDAQPFRMSTSAKLGASPDAVFAELGNPSLWWPLMRGSVWKTGATSGVGAEREVEVRTFGRFRERMLAWDPGHRVAFTMTATTSPLVAQMAEDWILTRDGDGSRLDWTVVARPTTIGRPITPALKAIMRAMFKRGCRNMEKRL